MVIAILFSQKVGAFSKLKNIMYVNDLIDRIISEINWLEVHPTPINFIALRNRLNHQLRQAIDDYVAEELAIAIGQLAAVDIQILNRWSNGLPEQAQPNSFEHLGRL